MYYVKSCSKEFNPKKTNNLKIGTIEEYRNTPIKEIKDVYEGTFTLNINLKDITIEIEKFNAINNVYGNFAFGNTKRLALKNFKIDSVDLKEYEAQITLRSQNSFIFCWSLLEKTSDCAEIFEGYDDYWHINEKNLHRFSENLAHCLYSQLYVRESLGTKVFEGDYDIENLQVNIFFQDIIYRERDFTLENNNFHIELEALLDCMRGIHFIKPLSFSKEKESRIIMDFYYNKKRLQPRLKNIIIAINDHLIDMIC